MLDRRRRERLKADHKTRRVRPCVDRERRAVQMRRRAERVHQVADQREVRHLLHRHRRDGAAPAGDRIALRGRPSGIVSLQAERGVEITAHQVVLDLRRFVQPVQQLFAARWVRGGVHRRTLRAQSDLCRDPLENVMNVPPAPAAVPACAGRAAAPGAPRGRHVRRPVADARCRRRACCVRRHARCGRRPVRRHARPGRL